MKKILSEMGEHIVNGIKYTIPLIVIYSVFSALVGAGYINVGNFDVNEYVFIVLVPILTAFIAHSISPKNTFVPGLILGYFFGVWGLGYLGGILGGLLLGYLVRCISSKIKIENEKLCLVIGYLGLGILGFIVTYFAMLYMAKPGILLILDSVSNLISSISPSETVLIVILLALFTTLDLGGPFNKIAYGFIIQFYTEGLFHITGPVLVSVMLPPLGVFLGLLLLKDRFNDIDHKSRKIALFGSLFGLTEGALVVGYRRPLKVLPILIIGSVVGSALASVMGLKNTSLLVSVPGLFTINNILVYLLSVVVGVSVMLILFYFVLPKSKNKLA
ncbi:PTS system mannose-specific EIIBCA component [Candidatus Izimaplasma bacterium HR1]|jgi:PTS system fructose-specific IIC component|uniref:hypothetical protein n=1 Tax=Candidatus Izimoplasma sp. HR1 TaxID=1541959 RepID=UPI0004F8F2A2|nr:PTS system mannose-specific EIIBCA component [Candidatus Izimaplasma bacterium HR1]